MRPEFAGNKDVWVNLDNIFLVGVVIALAWMYIYNDRVFSLDDREQPLAVPII
jgi:hypothetical protein